MKLVTYRRNNFVSCAILTDPGLIDISANWPGPNPPRTLKQILRRGKPCIEQLRHIADSADTFTALEDVKLLAPVPHPGKLIALAGNYSAHIKEAPIKSGFKLGLSASPRSTTVPRPFLMPDTAVIGPNDEIPWPPCSKEIDYEIELAVVIGRNAKSVPPEDALAYVAGYTIANDVSARSVTFADARKQRPWDDFYDWLAGKWADGFCPMGPYLLTADEIDNVRNLRLTLSVNGKVRQDANTSQMIYPVADIVSFLSHIMTLNPGDIIATGTPAGVAVATGHFLQPGDTIDAAIQNLGTLTNTLGQKPQKFYQPLSQNQQHP